MSKTKKQQAEDLGISLRTLYRREKAGTSAEIKTVTKVAANDVPVQAPVKKPEKHHPVHMPTSSVFLSRRLTVAFVAILILLDGVSMGVIGGKAYSWYVSPLFGLAGLAIGYSAIRQVLTYKGWSGDAWKWGFAIVQVALHLCAMDVVPYADISGKVVMSVAGALATAGIVDSMVKEQSK